MDEKRVRKAIAFFGRKIYELGELEEQTDGVLVHNIEYYLTAIEALEKQLLKKVKMRTEYRDLNDELICYKRFCPSCGNVVDSYRNKSCNHCTQMLDWSEAH